MMGQLMRACGGACFMVILGRIRSQVDYRKLTLVFVITVFQNDGN